jgi:UDP-2,4-diacetamido-2,4,6-trideoxy-beta-L-altropyranose hydrolase
VTVTVRPATADDEALLLEWANEPAARAAGFSPDPIPPDVHHRWLAGRLADPTVGRIWIGEEGGRPVGMVRVEPADDDVLVVSVAIARDARGSGRSRPLLDAGLAAARNAEPGRRLRAWIRPTNAASMRLFRGAGFAQPAVRPVAPEGAPPDVVVLERD